MRKKDWKAKAKDFDKRLAQAQHERDTALSKLHRIDSILHPPVMTTNSSVLSTYDLTKDPFWSPTGEYGP